MWSGQAVVSGMCGAVPAAEVTAFAHLNIVGGYGRQAGREWKSQGGEKGGPGTCGACEARWVGRRRVIGRGCYVLTRLMPFL